MRERGHLHSRQLSFGVCTCVTRQRVYVWGKGRQIVVDLPGLRDAPHMCVTGFPRLQWPTSLQPQGQRHPTAYTLTFPGSPHTCVCSTTAACLSFCVACRLMMTSEPPPLMVRSGILQAGVIWRLVPRQRDTSYGMASGGRLVGWAGSMERAEAQARGSSEGWCPGRRRHAMMEHKPGHAPSGI